MSLIWTESVDEINWQELSDLYKVAPLGDKSPAVLKIVFPTAYFDGSYTKVMYSSELGEHWQMGLTVHISAMLRFYPLIKEKVSARQ